MLHGLMSMLPIVQHFPEDRYIVIQTALGVCSIVEWAHVILGLSLLVRFSEEGITREVRFPPGTSSNEQILVDVTRPPSQYHFLEPYIVLLSTSTKEELFKLKAGPDDDIIDWTCKRPVKGLGSRVLESSTRQSTKKSKIIDETRLMACSFALRMSKNLRRHIFRPMSDHPSSRTGATQAHIPDVKIFDTCCFLFDLDEGEFSSKMVKHYEAVYDNVGFSHLEEHPPSWLAPELEEWKNNSAWKDLVEALKLTCLLILTFSHVTDLESCADFPVCEKVGDILQTSTIYRTQITSWDGKRPVDMVYTDCLSCISLMTSGYLGNSIAAEPDLEETCLLSTRGWSFYVNTFGTTDPSLIGL